MSQHHDIFYGSPEARGFLLTSGALEDRLPKMLIEQFRPLANPLWKIGETILDAYQAAEGLLGEFDISALDEKKLSQPILQYLTTLLENAPPLEFEGYKVDGDEKNEDDKIKTGKRKREGESPRPSKKPPGSMGDDADNTL